MALVHSKQWTLFLKKELKILSKQKDMEIKLTPMELFKKAKSSIVISFVLLVLIGIISSCNSLKYHKVSDSYSGCKNCIKYTFNYKTKIDSLTQDTVFVSGTTRSCLSNRIIHDVEITVYNELKEEVAKVSSNKNGKYSFKVVSGYYYLIAHSSPNSLILPITYFGDFGNILEMNLYLASAPILADGIYDPKLRKEVEQLKKKLKKEKKKSKV